MPEQNKTQSTEDVYQSYHSAVKNFSMYTPEGRRIIFVDGQFITNDPDFISYLDYEIRKGHPEIKKGKPVDKVVGDPLEGLKAKFFEEFKREQQEAMINKAIGQNQRDFGNTDKDSQAASKLNVASSTQQVTSKPSIQAKDPNKN